MYSYNSTIKKFRAIKLSPWTYLLLNNGFFAYFMVLLIFYKPRQQHRTEGRVPGNAHSSSEEYDQVLSLWWFPHYTWLCWSCRLDPVRRHYSSQHEAGKCCLNTVASTQKKKVTVFTLNMRQTHCIPKLFQKHGRMEEYVILHLIWKDENPPRTEDRIIITIFIPYKVGNILQTLSSWNTHLVNLVNPNPISSPVLAPYLINVALCSPAICQLFPKQCAERC